MNEGFITPHRGANRCCMFSLCSKFDSFSCSRTAILRRSIAVTMRGGISDASAARTTSLAVPSSVGSSGGQFTDSG